MHSKSFAIIVSDFNTPITSKLLDGAKTYLIENNIQEHEIEIIHVPGAVEIPFTAKLLLLKKTYSAIIGLGCVIRGETDHYDYVCQQVSYGCQKVMLDNMVPIIFGILTTQTAEQAWDRVGGKKGHKGIESAKTALIMTKLVSEH